MSGLRGGMAIFDSLMGITPREEVAAQAVARLVEQGMWQSSEVRESVTWDGFGVSAANVLGCNWCVGWRQADSSVAPFAMVDSGVRGVDFAMWRTAELMDGESPAECEAACLGRKLSGVAAIPSASETWVGAWVAIVAYWRAAMYREGAITKGEGYKTFYRNKFLTASESASEQKRGERVLWLSIDNAWGSAHAYLMGEGVAPIELNEVARTWDSSQVVALQRIAIKKQWKGIE